MKRFLCLWLVVFLFLICTGCGDVFRPVIIPNPPAFPDPRASHTVMAVNDNGTDQGSNMVVNVTGDSNVGVTNMGIGPVHAVQQTATQVLVVNQGAPGATDDSLTKISFFGTQISNTATISLPPGSAPNFVAVAPTDTTAYVTLPKLVPDPNFPTDNAVGAVRTNSNVLGPTIRVGNNPVAIAVTPDKNKLYVANRGSNSISNFNTLDLSPRNVTPITLSSSPLWLAARSDSQRVFVLEANGSLAMLDTTSTAGPDVLTEFNFNIPGANYMLYDGHLNRLYIPSTDISDPNSPARLAIVNVSGAQLPAPVIVPITTVAPSSRSAQDPCSATVATPLHAVAAAALPDGSRVYVGSFYIDGSGNVCPQVTVINTSGNTFKADAAVPGFPDATIPGSPYFVPVCATTRFRFTMAAGGDSSRVYLSSCDAGGVNIIDTANDTYLAILPAPASTRTPIPPSTQPPPQNPVFLIAGP